MKAYYVIVSEHGSVGYPKGFDTKESATEYFNKQSKAVLVRRCRFHESIINSKGLTEDEVDSLMC
jgi:hypothetical protein